MIEKINMKVPTDVTEFKNLFGKSPNDFKIFVGVSTVNNNVHNSLNLLSIQSLLNRLGINSVFTVNSSDKNIFEAKRKIFLTFLKTDCTHLLMIDGNITYTDDIMIGLLKSNQKIIGGLVPHENYNFKHLDFIKDISNIEKDKKSNFGSKLLDYELVFKDPNKIEIVDGLIEVEELSTSFIFMDRAAFSEILDEEPDFLKNFSFSNDKEFCDLIKFIGFGLYVSPILKINKTAYHTFYGDFLSHPFLQGG